MVEGLSRGEDMEREERDEGRKGGMMRTIKFWFLSVWSHPRRRFTAIGLLMLLLVGGVVYWSLVDDDMGMMKVGRDQVVGMEMGKNRKAWRYRAGGESIPLVKVRNEEVDADGDGEAEGDYDEEEDDDDEGEDDQDKKGKADEKEEDEDEQGNDGDGGRDDNGQEEESGDGNGEDGGDGDDEEDEENRDGAKPRTRIQKMSGRITVKKQGDGSSYDTLMPNAVLLHKENFHKLIREQEEKDSLVMFYNQDCGHCKEMAPYFNSAGEILHSMFPDLLVGAYPLAGGDNVTVDFKIMGVPDIRYFPKRWRAKNESLRFIATRNVEELVRFVEQARAGKRSK